MKKDFFSESDFCLSFGREKKKADAVAHFWNMVHLVTKFGKGNRCCWWYYCWLWWNLWWWWWWWHFSSHNRIWGEESMNNSPPAPFFFSFFFTVGISLCASVSLFRSGSFHSGAASWDGCTLAFSYKLHVRLFPWEVPTPRLDSILSPLLLHLVKCVYTCAFILNLPLHFRQNDEGLLHATAVTHR